MPSPRDPIIIVGGFMSWPSHFDDLARMLREMSGRDVHTVPLTPADWLGAILFGRHGQLVFEIATTLDKALLESGTKQAVLVAHSAGGVASRVYIGGDPPFGGRRWSGHRRVSHLITLGSPHLVQDVWPLAPLHRANELFPGSLHESIRYVSVAGTAVDGKTAPKSSRRTYERLVGNPDVVGDGVVPLRAALLPGSEQLVFDDLHHDSAGGRRKWYASDEETVSRWWPRELVRTDDTEPDGNPPPKR